jgi:FkbM family methyltransferase
MIELIDTKEGVVASIKGDSHITKWIKEHNSLVTDQTVPVRLLPLINEGDTILDIGANIGGHTVSYARKVGVSGSVIAIEPNMPSFICLAVNCRDFPQVQCAFNAIGDSQQLISMECPHTTNIGMARVSFSNFANVPMVRVDDMELKRCNFIKADCEGYEPNVIKGAMETLRRFKPIIFIEINKSALAHFRFTPDDILKPLAELGYRIDGTPDLNADQVDILFLPT